MAPKQTQAAIIFDFDGTLADDFDVSIRAFYELTRRQPMPAEDISRLRGLSTGKLLRALGIPLWQVPFLAQRARRALAMKLNEIEPVPGIASAIRTLSKTHRLFVVSSNSAANVRQVLGRCGLAKSFVAVYGNARPLHKERSLHLLLKSHSIQPADAWYVGDEVRDIEAAHKAGVRVASVSWGYNNIGALERHHPDRLVFTPEELVAALSGASTKL